MSWGYRDILGPKNYTRKTSNICKDFELLYQVFMHNFSCQNVPIFPFYIFLTRRIDTFLSEGIDTFCSRVNETVWHRKSLKKSTIDNIHKYLLNYTNFQCMVFYAKLSWNLHFTNYLYYTQTTWLIQFCVITHPNSFTSDLAYNYLL